MLDHHATKDDTSQHQVSSLTSQERSHLWRLLVEGEIDSLPSNAVIQGPAADAPLAVPYTSPSTSLVLIVSANTRTAVTLEASLDTQGISILALPDPGSAMPLVRDDDSDIALALVEVSHPARSGLKLAAAIRNHHPDAALILTSAHGSERLVTEALRLGADDYLPHPVQPNELVAATRRALTKRATRLESSRRLATLRAWSKKLQRLAVLDPLTSLYNRRYFEIRLDGELRRAARSPRPMALALIDLDGFKGLNDRRGHRAGDRFLQEVGQTLRGRCRGSDVACRYGGDEFAIILPDTDATGAHSAADAFRQALARVLPPSSIDRERLITASIGVAMAPKCGHTTTQLIAAADEALYRAKREGRDCVRLARPLGSTD